ncbi:ferritin-like fold-containing protein [Gordonia jinhuaensis]|uniref:Hydroxylase n=1 Tax=Gordonia jinhuaensis TaxID=1517702 RepID=A0A916T8Z4_9ACTN|nr:ferritin-like fold-containing protein [Gordonia jinhuaensis]GGB34722.1 hydroxylase [Gordonia jinhuaensis]
MTTRSSADTQTTDESRDPVSAPTTDLGTARASVAVDHPGISALFGVLAAGEIAAFYRLTSEATMALSMRAKVAMARMAASEMGHFETLSAALEERGVDVMSAIERYSDVIERYHGSTTPRNWLESVVKAYIGDALAADFYVEVAEALPAPAQQVVRDVMSATVNSEFACAEVHRALENDPALRSPLTLWGRRLLGEAITQTQYALAAEESLTDMLFSGMSDLSMLTRFFDAIQERHAARMADLGLG